MNSTVLCVDDGVNILKAYRRQLQDRFDIETASSPKDGLRSIQESGPYAVVVSDMNMPEMDGIQFLSEVRRIEPSTIRIMLTGNADLQSTINAVNEGNIFRFLSKPCPTSDLSQTIDAGLEQYRLVMAEKELLEQTLSGSIQVLTEVLSLVNPSAFARASRISRVAERIAEEIDFQQMWKLRIAAMLSQLGCVTVPEECLEKVYSGEELNNDESEIFERHPQVAKDLIASIPRLEDVAEIILYQCKRYDGGGLPTDGYTGDEIPLGSRILKVATDFDLHESQRCDALEAYARLLGKDGCYDPKIIQALEPVAREVFGSAVKEINLIELRDGMVLAADVTSTDDSLVVGKGQKVTPSLRQRLENFTVNRVIREPLLIQCDSDHSCVAEANAKEVLV